jgi:hypothetical protein
MKRPLLFATIWLCAVSAFAQPMQTAGPGAERQVSREQRRAELRTALQANRQAQAQSTKTYDMPPAGRHLTPRELAEMRQQLRQQPTGGQNSRP